MNYYRRYIGDYARDTGHLSLAEHGAYTLLLDAIYATERPLPTDLKSLYRICRATAPSERRAVASVADQFFPVDGDKRMNSRAKREIDENAPRIKAARENGTKGGRPKKPRENPAGSEKEPAGEALHPPDPSVLRTEGEKAPSVWDVGRKILGGGLLGKLLKQHGDEPVKRAILATLDKRPADEKTYLLGALKNGTNGQGHSGEPRRLSAVDRARRANGLADGEADGGTVGADDGDVRPPMAERIR